MALCGPHMQTIIYWFSRPPASNPLLFSSGFQLQARNRCCKISLPWGCSVFLLLAWNVIQITTACKAELLNVSFSLFWHRGAELIVIQIGFYCFPLCISTRRNIEEYEKKNIWHQEEGWIRLATAAMLARADFNESKAIEESCLKLLCSL